MTRENVVEILERFVLGAKPCSQKEIVDACASAYRMLKEQPSLPSNLEEAAENRVTENGRFEITPFEKMRIEDIKFGAEWMAGQGYTREVDINEDAGGYPYIPCIELYDYDKEEPLFKPGDKVVVQIRKK